MKPRLTIESLQKTACAGLNPHLFEKVEPEPKKPKYGNKKVVIDGIEFDSKKEGNRYRYLKFRESIGEITNLQRQKVYELKVDDKLICRYKSDFEYDENGEHVTEDVKSNYTRKLPVYRLKKKLMKELLKIQIREI